MNTKSTSALLRGGDGSESEVNHFEQKVRVNRAKSKTGFIVSEVIVNRAKSETESAESE